MKVLPHCRRNVWVAAVLLALVVVTVAFYTLEEQTDDGDMKVNISEKQNIFKRSLNRECHCGIGLRVKRECTETEDVECEACPTGTYSNTVDNLTNSCQDCTFVRCPQHSKQVSPCKAESDIVCKCKQGYEKLGNGGDKGFSCLSSYATAKADKTTEIAKIINTTDDPNHNSGGKVNLNAWLILVPMFYNIWYII